MPAPDIDFAHYLDLKYQNQGMQARANAAEAYARAGLLGAQQREVAPDAASSRQLNATNSLLSRAQANNLNARTPAQAALEAAQARLYGAQATGAENDNELGTIADVYGLSSQIAPYLTPTPEDIIAHPRYSSFFGPRAIGQPVKVDSTLPAPNMTTISKITPTGTTTQDVLNEDYTNSSRLGFKKGIARVPGKGDGTKDTVKAKLAPGEAVLNKAAANHMGRGLIAMMNKMGAQKMGLA